MLLFWSTFGSSPSGQVFTRVDSIEALVNMISSRVAGVIRGETYPRAHDAAPTLCHHTMVTHLLCVLTKCVDSTMAASPGTGLRKKRVEPTDRSTFELYLAPNGFPGSTDLAKPG